MGNARICHGADDGGHSLSWLQLTVQRPADDDVVEHGHREGHVGGDLAQRSEAIIDGTQRVVSALCVRRTGFSAGQPVWFADSGVAGRLLVAHLSEVLPDGEFQGHQRDAHHKQADRIRDEEGASSVRRAAVWKPAHVPELRAQHSRPSVTAATSGRAHARAQARTPTQ